jgi:O-antigen biosynthesis protein
MGYDTTIFGAAHNEALELLATRALSSDDAATAFEFADRRCRISPAPTSNCYLLRAEASFRMGEAAAAISDLDIAVDASPQDRLINRRLLAWCEDARKVAAAAALLANERDHGTLRSAVAVLRKQGRHAFAALSVLDDEIRGWAAWTGNAPVELAIAGSGGRVSITLEPDLFHPLSGRDLHAVAINVARPRSTEPQSITLATGTEIFYTARAPANETIATSPPPVHAAAERGVTVIVPVYQDYAATKACLDSLTKALETGPGYRALIINDASPDIRVRRYLSGLKGQPGLEVVSNPTNLGFVGTVNRALALVRSGDVLLLNADTITPPRFLDRLVAAAHASPDIGTVTPLSNNGELMSFPVPYNANALPSPDEINAIDDVAAQVNRGAIVDVPNGIGFCLYIKRECLDRLGGLSESFQRGYFEEVDFCLRARDIGFRSVCAPNVYVGHVGSRSFRDEKRSLAGRNLKILGGRFPKYPMESLAFVDADPLMAPRAAIELALPARQGRILLVVGNGVLKEVAGGRAQHLTSGQISALICEIRRGTAGHTVRLFDPEGGTPQSVAFSLPEEREQLLDFIKRSAPSRIEFVDPANTPADLAVGLCELGVPHDLTIADAGLFGGDKVPAPSELATAMRQREFPLGGSDRDGRLAHPSSTPQPWARILDSADRIHVPCTRSASFAAKFLSDEQAAKLTRAKPGKATRIGIAKTADRLGIVPVRTSSVELKLMREVARFMKAAHPQLSIAIIGETLDDLALMRLGNVFVSGRVNASELARLVRQYRVNRLFTGLGHPLFGHPMVEAALHSGLPVAYFDWSMGECRPKAGELALDPSLSANDTAAVLGRWIAER